MKSYGRKPYHNYIQLPIQARNKVGIGRLVEISQEGDAIVIRPHRPECAVCGSQVGLMRPGQRQVFACRHCCRGFGPGWSWSEWHRMNGWP